MGSNSRDTRERTHKGCLLYMTSREPRRTMRQGQKSWYSLEKIRSLRMSRGPLYPTYGGRGTYVGTTCSPRRRVPVAPRAVVEKESVGWAGRAPLRGPALRNGGSGLRFAALQNLRRREGTADLRAGLSGGCREVAGAGLGWMVFEGMCGPPCETSATSWGPMFSGALVPSKSRDPVPKQNQTHGLLLAPARISETKEIIPI